jgi:hypothetical protein
VDIALCTLSEVFFFEVVYGQQNPDIDNLVEMPGDFVQFARHVIAQGWGDVKVVSADGQVHK